MKQSWKEKSPWLSYLLSLVYTDAVACDKGLEVDIILGG